MFRRAIASSKLTDNTSPPILLVHVFEANNEVVLDWTSLPLLHLLGCTLAERNLFKCCFRLSEFMRRHLSIDTEKIWYSLWILYSPNPTTARSTSIIWPFAKSIIFLLNKGHSDFKKSTFTLMALLADSLALVWNGWGAEPRPTSSRSCLSVHSAKTWDLYFVNQVLFYLLKWVDFTLSRRWYWG